MSDEEIAVRLLALEEGEAFDTWLEHWSARFPTYATAEHSGDCTNQPWTCDRCVYEETMARVPFARKFFGLAV